MLLSMICVQIEKVEANWLCNELEDDAKVREHIRQYGHTFPVLMGRMLLESERESQGVLVTLQLISSDPDVWVLQPLTEIGL